MIGHFQRTTCELVAATYGKAAAAGATSGELYAIGATGKIAGLALAQAMAIRTTIAICTKYGMKKTTHSCMVEFCILRKIVEEFHPHKNFTVWKNSCSKLKLNDFQIENG